MENHHPHAPASLFLSILNAIFAWISIEHAQIVFGFIASLAAIISGIFAARYYWYATKEKKKILAEKNKPYGFITSKHLPSCSPLVQDN